jgi:hypothetical protein
MPQVQQLLDHRTRWSLFAKHPLNRGPVDADAFTTAASFSGAVA